MYENLSGDVRDVNFDVFGVEVFCAAGVKATDTHFNPLEDRATAKDEIDLSVGFELKEHFTTSVDHEGTLDEVGSEIRQLRDMDSVDVIVDHFSPTQQHHEMARAYDGLKDTIVSRTRRLVNHGFFAGVAFGGGVVTMIHDLADSDGSFTYGWLGAGALFTGVVAAKLTNDQAWARESNEIAVPINSLVGKSRRWGVMQLVHREASRMRSVASQEAEA